MISPTSHKRRVPLRESSTKNSTTIRPLSRLSHAPALKYKKYRAAAPVTSHVNDAITHSLAGAGELRWDSGDVMDCDVTAGYAVTVPAAMSTEAHRPPKNS